MLDPEKHFENFFNSVRITNLRLYNFCVNTINILTVSNTGGEYTELIAILSAITDSLGVELGELASSTAVQKAATFTNDEVLASFKLTMSIKEGVIADAVGGKHTAAYLEFFPQGLQQYSKALKTNMPTLVQVIFDAATKYADDLGPKQTGILQSFKKSWENSRDAQQQQMGDVKNNIADKWELRPQLEIAATKVIHGIAFKFPGDVKSCMAFFNFNLLYPQKHHKAEPLKSDVPAGKTATAQNKTVEESMKFSFHNPTNNAPYAAWLAADENEPYVEGKGIIVQPGKTVDKNAPDLGDLKNTFCASPT